ncbi:hypothetical protein QBC44DRAFT_374604 [Cladorrhinum sp. PSN332]|nr:hypothetical protein QBC44DRAFT_374604 [Cladorrhinum sp. PSN332]
MVHNDTVESLCEPWAAGNYEVFMFFLYVVELLFAWKEEAITVGEIAEGGTWIYF